MTLRRALPLSAALLLLAQAAWAVPGTLRLGLQDPPSTLDPALASNIPAIGVSHWLYNGLVGFDAKAQVVPELAERFTVSPSGKKLTFKLRAATFHDGRKVTANDVKYSLTRLLWPETKSPGASLYRAIAGSAEVLSGHTRELRGVSAPKPDTVEITLSEPQATFLQVLGLNFAAILPAGEGEKPTFATHPIGTGPFVLNAIVAGQRLTFARNPRYFRSGAPKLNAIEVQLGLNEQVEALRFERGELDAIGLLRNIGAADYTRLSNSAQWRDRMLSGPDNSTYYVGMNTRLKPFDNPKVRAAIAMAINKSKLVRLVNGRGIPATAFLPPTLPGADPTLKGYSYDPAKAKAMLAAAGFASGFDTTYWCSNSQTALKVAQSIQQDLSLIGVRAALKPLAFPSFLAAVGREGNAPIFTGNWSQDYPDPANFLGTLFWSHSIRPVNSVNTTFFTDPQVDSWLEAAAKATANPLRMALYHQVERRVLELAPVVPLYHPRRFVMFQNGVSGLVLHPVWPLAIEDVTVTK